MEVINKRKTRARLITIKSEILISCLQEIMSRLITCNQLKLHVLID